MSVTYASRFVIAIESRHEPFTTDDLMAAMRNTYPNLMAHGDISVTITDPDDEEES